MCVLWYNRVGNIYLFGLSVQTIYMLLLLKNVSKSPKQTLNNI